MSKSESGIATAKSTVTGDAPLARAIRKVGLFSFVFVMYSYNTAGPFGLEDQVRTSGPGMSLLYQLIIPFFWCIPISLVAAELTTAMPVEGGFYRWTRAAFGDFWGFLAGWWNWTASFLLGALYAVLFADYLSFYFPQLMGWRHYGVALLVIALITYVNVCGIRLVGRIATVLELGILGTVAVMCVMAIPKWHHNPFVPFVPPHVPMFQVFGVGLSLGLWLYAGYEQVSSVAEEVEDPQRSYPRALAWVVPLSMATYLLPTIVCLAAVGKWDQWHSGYFSDLASAIGGPKLGFAITLAAGVMNLSILNSTVLTTTRMPAAMAEDGYLSPFLARIHPKFGTPWIAILLSAAVYCLFAGLKVTQLIPVYIWLRIATSVLTVLSAWRLRRTRPELQRAFLIPWKGVGLAYAVVAPLVISAVALIIPMFSSAEADRFSSKWGPVVLLLGPIAYLLLRRKVTVS
ncbi:MAG TPA: APC family permease [Terriglobales bacterium]